MRRHYLIGILVYLVSEISSQNAGNFNFQTLPWWYFLTAPNTQSTTTTTATTTTTTNPPTTSEPVKLECFDQPKCQTVDAQRFYIPEGICNNRVDKNRGRTHRPLKRLLPPDYGDGRGSLRRSKSGNELPPARFISLQLTGLPQKRSFTVSHMMPWWGQFLSHEIAHTTEARRDDGAKFNCRCENPDLDGCINIVLNKTDIHYRKRARLCLELKRSEAVPNLDCDSTIREQKNANTAFIDASTVYGNNKTDMEHLLDRHSSLKLEVTVIVALTLTSPYLYSWVDYDLAIGELMEGDYTDSAMDRNLPLQTQVNRDFAPRMTCSLFIHKPANKPCIVAGDVRANQNIGLTSLHSLFMRFHNKIIRQLHTLNPSWKQDQLVKETRKIVAAVQQIITYDSFLPVILGQRFMQRFKLNTQTKGYWYGYDSSIDASISNEFTTAAYRFGHTTITKTLSRLSPDFETPEADRVEIKDTFFNSNPIFDSASGGVNSIIRGLLKDHSQLSGTSMIRDMTDFLFTHLNEELGEDLFAINIKRNRDHGLSGYNEYRSFCGLKRATSFFDMSEIKRESQEKLAKIYTEVDDIDLYIGGLSETAVEGGVVGPTFACIIAYQFREIKMGDRLWFENGAAAATFTPEQLNSIKQYSYAKFLCDTISDLRTVQPNPMLLQTAQSNRRKFCSEYSSLTLDSWKDFAWKSSNVKEEEGMEFGYVMLYTDSRPAKTMNTHIQQNLFTVYCVYDKANRPYGTEWSPWFPCVTPGGNTMSVASVLNDALIYRRDDVCRNVLNSETRYVNSIQQVRFECPRGTIKGTDYPFVESEQVFFTEWIDRSTPHRLTGDDDETHGETNEYCKRPLAIQAQTIEGIPARETGDVFQSFSPLEGLVCKGVHQLRQTCSDYRVRYLCRREKNIVPRTERRSSSNTKKVLSNEFKWTPWSNVDSPVIQGDRELLSDVQTKPGYCRKPWHIHARTVGSHVIAYDTGDKLQELDHRVGLICVNEEQTSGLCQDYEVRYLCRENDINDEQTVPQAIKEQAQSLCVNYGKCC